MSDYEVRLRLAKMIGLDAVPEPDECAIDRLAGCLDKYLGDIEIDAVEIVKEVRESSCNTILEL